MTASTTTAPSSDGGSAAYRWYVLALLFGMAIVNSMDRTIIAALAEPLKAEFHLSDTQFGFLAGMAFAISYTLCGIPIGLMVDRVNRAKLLASLAFVWGGATMVMGAATSFMGLVVTRLCVAGAESGGSPTSVSLLGDYFPPDKRATAIGAFYSASGIAAFLSFALAGWIGAHYGWRVAIICAGAPGVILGTLAFFTLREPKRGAFEAPSAAAAAKPARASLRTIGATMVRLPTLRYLGIASVLSVFGVAGTGAFTASFFTRVHGLPLAEAGLVTGLVMGGAYALGAVLGGFMSDLTAKRSPGGGCYFVGAATLLAFPCAAAGYLAPDLTLSIALVFMFKVLVGAFYGATFASISRVAPIAVRGAITTYMMLLMNLCGYGGGPQLTGIFSDLFKAAGYVDPLKWGLAATSSVFLLSALFFILAGRGMKGAPVTAA